MAIGAGDRIVASIAMASWPSNSVPGDFTDRYRTRSAGRVTRTAAGSVGWKLKSSCPAVPWAFRCIQSSIKQAANSDFVPTRVSSNCQSASLVSGMATRRFNSAVTFSGSPG